MIFKAWSIRLEEWQIKGLFDSGAQLLSAMGALINEAGVKINHQKVTDSVRTITWDTLTKAIQEREKEIEIFIEEALQEELGISLEQLKEMYGEDIVERLTDIMQEKRVNRMEQDSAQKFVLFAIGDLTGYSADKVGERYYYTDSKGIKKVLTKHEAGLLLKKQAELEMLISVAYGEVGTKEIDNTNQVKYNDWYYGGSNKYGSDAAWCAVFTMWCGINDELELYFAGDYRKNHG